MDKQAPIDLQPYREILTRLGFKETESTKNFWVINSVDMKTGKPAKAGIYINFCDHEDKVGEPHLFTEEAEVMEKEAYERCANLHGFYKERELLLEHQKEKGMREKTEEMKVEEESNGKSPYVMAQPIEIRELPKSEEIPQEKLFDAVRQKIKDIKDRDKPKTPSPPGVTFTVPKQKPETKIEVQRPQVVYKMDKEKVTTLKNDTIKSIQNEMSDLSLQIEEIRREIEERRLEDEIRIREYEDKISFLESKWEIVEETYDKILRELG